MKKIDLFLLILISFFLFSCQSVKDGLSGRKNENSDEFLVQKKNPLVLPPNYLELPLPKSEGVEEIDKILEEETEIESLLKKDTITKNSSKKDYGNAEEFVLENIK